MFKGILERIIELAAQQIAEQVAPQVKDAAVRIVANTIDIEKCIERVVDESVVDEDRLHKMAAGLIADDCDYSQLVDGLKERLDLDDMLDMDEVIAQLKASIDYSSLAYEIDKSDVACAIDMDELADAIDLDDLARAVNLSELADEIDVTQLDVDETVIAQLTEDAVWQRLLNQLQRLR